MHERRFFGNLNASWLALAGILLGLALALGANLRVERSRVEAREQERLLAQTRVVQLVLEGYLSSLHGVLGDLCADWARGKTGRDFNQRLTILEQGMPGVRTLLVLDNLGLARAANRPELLGRNFRHRDYFQNIQQHPAPDMLYITPPYTTALGVFSVNLCRMIPGPHGEFAGVILATLDPKFFAPLLGSILYAPDMCASIVHSSGILYLLLPERDGMAGKDLARPGTFFSQHLESGNEASVFSGTTYATGEERMLALRTIQPIGVLIDKHLVATASRDLDAIYAGWRMDFVWQSGLFLAVALFSSAGLYAFERRKREYEHQQVLTAQALADNERFIGIVTDNIPGMVGYWNQDLRCSYANSAYGEWLGRTRAEMLGAHLLEVLGGELFRKNEVHIRAALRGEPQSFERAVTKADGSTGHVLVNYIPDRDGERVRGFFVLVTDVTELKLAQHQLESRVEERTEELRCTVEDLEQAKTQAESANRMKSEFLANLSHELRTPLNPIVALTDLVLGTELSAEQRDYLEDVRDAAQNLLKLFNRLIELMELESYTPDPGVIGLDSLREMVVQNISAAVQAKGLSLEGAVAPGLPQAIWSDLHLLRMALLELADNAVRFTHEGVVAIDLDRVADDAAGDMLCIAVRDTGIGIPAERLADINTGLTQADATLNKRYAGLGIGMAKARKAIALLGGRLEVESAPGQGSRFYILLPFTSVDLPGHAS